MAVNKVVYGTTVLVDLTKDTVTADTLKKGSTAHNSAGELITGTYEGSGGGGGGSAGTCNVTINVPGQVAIIGWGECTYNVPGTPLNGSTLMPSTKANAHYMPINTIYNFPSIPIGSTFVFHYSKDYIKGATVSDNIEFSFVNTNTMTTSDYNFATCRCNGDGEITINV